MSKAKVILVIRDGWGYRESSEDNIIASANTPNDDRLMVEYPHTLLKASGKAVGLPDGYQGNSEVGHMTIGSGRIIYQSLERINHSIESGEFFNIPEFNESIDKCIDNNSSLHLMGLVQKEGVHSHINHLFALLDLCQKRNFSNVLIHIFTDGRDASVSDGIKNVGLVVDKISELGFGEIVSVSGRCYAMDRDNKWERTEKAYRCIAEGIGKEYADVLKTIKESYKNEETDEFIVPKKKKGYEGIKDGDSVIFFNFRTDRPGQLTKALVEDGFDKFERKRKNINFVAMTEYYSGMNGEIAFKEQPIKNILGEVLSKNGIKQLRISETEKYAHITFFFNCQREEPFENEDRELIPSPRIATYDLQPEMSAYKITDKLIEAISLQKYEFIVVNLVNCDMVGHTGNVEAIKKAVETVDDCVGRVVEEGLKKNYHLIVFADHGNAEDKGGQTSTSHTVNPVPCILVLNDFKEGKLKEGGLQDIAPTVLKIMGIDKPSEMTGESLID